MRELLWEEVPSPANFEEEVLLEPLLAMLRSRRWIGPSTLLRTEFPWNGRRVDLVTLSSTGTASAFELKLSSFQRVMEQAIYNRLSFDRSWIVVANTPNDANLATAREYGVGVIVLQDRMRVVGMAARQPRSNRKIRARLLERLWGQQRGIRVR